MEKWKELAISCKTILGLCIILMGISCGPPSADGHKGKSLGELNDAISVIRDRRDSEYKVLSQEKYAISVLTDNIEKSNSEGMKDKIRDEIVVKRAVIFKAKKNIANQDLILEELIGKRDSIEAVNARGNE